MKIIVLIGSLLVLVLSLLFIVSIEDESAVPSVMSKPIMRVAVKEVQMQAHKAQLYDIALLEPKDALKINASFSGDIVFRSSKLVEGGMVKKGEKLLALENIDHIVALNEAKYRVDEAKYEYLKEDKRHRQALKDWKRIGEKKPSNLALNIPQRHLAKSNLVLAKSLLKQKEMDLDKTVIKAPFSGIILKNEVKTSSSVQEGEVLFEIASRDTLVGSIELNAKEWELLKSTWKKSFLEVERIRDKTKSTATLTHGGGYVASNLFKLYFTLNDDSFMFGDFVKVSLPTKNIAHSIKVPNTAVSPNGLLWYIDSNNTLQSLKAKELMPQKDHTILVLPDTNNNMLWHIVIMPLSSFYQGMRVAPMVKR